MDIHEYQAKELLRHSRSPPPTGRWPGTPPRRAAITQEFGGQSVVKAQIHAGGRGKGGGVKFAKTPDEAAELFDEDARHDPGDQADRPRGAQGAAPCTSPGRWTSPGSST